MQVAENNNRRIGPLQGAEAGLLRGAAYGIFRGLEEHRRHLLVSTRHISQKGPQTPPIRHASAIVEVQHMLAPHPERLSLLDICRINDDSRNLIRSPPSSRNHSTFSSPLRLPSLSPSIENPGREIRDGERRDDNSADGCPRGPSPACGDMAVFGRWLR